jgi:hypothetical protein
MKTTYERVYPRDLFNEACLLKCLGRLTLLILDGKLDLPMPENIPVEIDLDQDNSRLYSNLEFYTKSGDPLYFCTPYNSRDHYPLLCVSEDDEVYSVFEDSGELHQEFLGLLESLAANGS